MFLKKHPYYTKINFSRNLKDFVEFQDKFTDFCDFRKLNSNCQKIFNYSSF